MEAMSVYANNLSWVPKQKIIVICYEFNKLWFKQKKTVAAAVDNAMSSAGYGYNTVHVLLMAAVSAIGSLPTEWFFDSFVRSI